MSDITNSNASTTELPPQSPPDQSTRDQPTALIPGGSAGLGLVVAATFAQAGYRVIIVGRSQDRLDDAVEQLRQQHNATAITLVGDMTNRDDCQQIAQAVGQRCGRLDVLVNCIGVSDRGLVGELTAARVHELIDQNVVATLLCCQAMLPMLESSRGSIVNIGSLAGKVGARYLGGYNTAKHALTGLTQQMRLEWRDKGVHVGLVSPGPIRRDDAGTRYQHQTGNSALPGKASQPGGGTKVKGIEPQRVATAVLNCARNRKPDVILPGYLRLLIVVGNALPRLGDWLLLKFTS
ncbi:SDR family oxidoreductase [Stieleria sp. TO1_6]|uniref:SDR family NAD(P)-dependent oxidoreductase n=1 Tax=Stieleria tagensis TaxID=2956795 RepID=UPI00209BA617|nr:SDR family oxidoreductase [Stieleria tagensis]MCO8124233.1 SDR family oxidoreductase [Stieleria tagensis]